MNDFYQVKLADGPRISDATRESAAQMGLTRARWEVRTAMWCEDYFDLDREDIDNHIAMNWSCGREATINMELGDGKSALVAIREVPKLVRQGNSDQGYIVQDDIAHQMASEASEIAQELIPPSSGWALSWFAGELGRFVEGKS